jgi:predicted AAA+ superfamily ATPase
MPTQSWTKVLKLRPEVVASDGGVGDLQMSLHRAVYQTAKAPYQDVAYYGDITEPTPNLVGFFARIARRLSGADESVALYHLDQGMGGGKSHALVGLYHMASNQKAFFQTHIGKDVFKESRAGGSQIEFSDARVVTLTADHFSPGKATETFGPATNLFERFLWGLFAGDRAKYDAAVAEGANKATLQKALASVNRPILILLDELMDYVMELSSADALGTMPSEQAFLNALMDACDDVPRVAFVLVMIRTELDQQGYTPSAEGFREYLSARINRNGATIAVTETGDFAAIIRRRIFEQAKFETAAGQVAIAYQKAVAADPGWSSQVLDRL